MAGAVQGAATAGAALATTAVHTDKHQYHKGGNSGKRKDIEISVRCLVGYKRLVSLTDLVIDRKSVM